MLSQMDPSLVTFCDKIADEGGPVSLPSDVDGATLPQTPVIQMLSVTRASARLRNVQPEVNLDQSYEAMKRPKKHVDAAQAGILFTIPIFFFKKKKICLIAHTSDQMLM